MAKECPAWVGDYGKMLWDKLSPKLDIESEGVYTALAMACSHYHIFRVCSDQLATEGIVFDGLHGLKEHPAISIQQKQSVQLQKLLKQLGLIEAKQQAEESDPLSEFMES